MINNSATKEGQMKSKLNTFLLLHFLKLN